jgi:peptidoglycan/xylan/chitin deacetylase (PgdA/CDA1 family)
MRIYLLSIDLEDFRLELPNPNICTPRVMVLVKEWLGFLEKLNIKITFFCVANICEHYRGLISMIADSGHEIALHSLAHTPLTKMNESEFEDDLGNALALLKTETGQSIIGYRAPTFSMVESTRGFYKILSKHGIQYSSSVLPAANPLFGWPGFGYEPRSIDGICEIPISVTTLGIIPKIPFAGGTYFRLLPRWILLRLFKTYMNEVITGYFHPYDIDTLQERVMHPHMRNWAMNELMYMGRGSLLSKLEYIIREISPTIMKYSDYCRYLNKVKA